MIGRWNAGRRARWAWTRGRVVATGAAAAVLALTAALVVVPLLRLAGPAVPAVAAPAQQPALTVFAAASLTESFREIGAGFEAATGVPVTFSFGASSQLRVQLEQGAVADVFASADQAQMDAARAAGVLRGPDALFATNRLVVIAPRGNPAGIRSAADLANPGVKLVTAASEVPIGAYTQAMFETMSRMAVFGSDFQDRANANVVSREPNVRQVVAKVQLGEADAAVVYLTDVTPRSAPGLLVIAIPDDLNTVATYPVALVAGGPQAELGQAFVDLVLSPAGQAILQKWNFTPVGPTALAPAADRTAFDGRPDPGRRSGGAPAAAHGGGRPRSAR